MNLAEKAARTDAPVLILGETGTGKELFARYIHNFSQRRSLPFVPVDCAALPNGLEGAELFGHKRGAFTGAVENRQGLIRAAGSGTLFLDEIGDLPLHAQPGLLRFLQEAEVRPNGEEQALPADCRVVAATNCDLRESVKANRFRSDLYYRLAVIVITIPPLRDRHEDLLALAKHFLHKHAGQKQPDLQMTSLHFFIPIVGREIFASLRMPFEEQSALQSQRPFRLQHFSQSRQCLSMFRLQRISNR